MYACESSIKVMLLDTEGYSFFENNFPKCDIHADSVRARKEKNIFYALQYLWQEATIRGMAFRMRS